MHVYNQMLIGVFLLITEEKSPRNSLKMLAKTGSFMQAFKPAALRKQAYGASALKACNSLLIYCHLLMFPEDLRYDKKSPVMIC